MLAERGYGQRRALRRPYGRRPVRRDLGSYIKRTVNNLAETKFYTNTLVLAATTPVGQVSWADNLSTGTTSLTRIGNQIRVKTLSFKLNYIFTFNAGGDNFAVTRLLVLYPRKSTDNATLTSVISTLSTVNRPDPLRVIVLYDECWSMSGVGLNSTYGSPCFVQKEFILKIPYVFNYDAGFLLAREPVIVYLSTLGAANPSTLAILGYSSMAFKDF